MDQTLDIITVLQQELAPYVGNVTAELVEVMSETVVDF